MRKYDLVWPNNFFAFFTNIFLFFFVKYKIIFFSFPSYKRLCHIIIGTIVNFAKSAKSKTRTNNSLLKIINILVVNHYYLFPSYNVRVYMVLLNLYETFWIISLNSIRNRSHLKNKKKLLHIEVNLQNIYSDWIADPNFLGFIKIRPLSE